jgi:hypothetical protein
MTAKPKRRKAPAKEAAMPETNDYFTTMFEDCRLTRRASGQPDDFLIRVESVAGRAEITARERVGGQAAGLMFHTFRRSHYFV